MVHTQVFLLSLIHHLILKSLFVNYRPDDLAKSFWAVEAAPEGMLITFHVERDELSGQWQVRKAISKSAVQVEEDE